MNGNNRVACKMLAVEVTPQTVGTLLDEFSRRLASGVGATVAGHNLHSVYLYHTDCRLQEFYRGATIVLADGAPVLWDYRLSGNPLQSDRVGSTDWIPHLGRVSGLSSIMVIGASRYANDLFVERLEDFVPEAVIRGIPGLGWNEERAEAALEDVERYAPNLIMSGLGMPLQESFAWRVALACPGSIVATVGGAIDQIAGVQRNAPRWLGKYGLEWVWRLVSQPRRLWSRYLIEPWKLIGVRVRQEAKRIQREFVKR